MALRGGIRDRMIIESVVQAVTAELQTEGWFDAGRQHAALTIVDEFPQDTDEVATNTLAFSFETAVGRDAEMGSNAEEHTMNVFVDFFAESDALGRHVAGDIYAFFKETRHVPVYDYRLATPVVEFYAEVDEDVEKRKPSRAVNPWQKHWHVVAVSLTDDRANV